MNCWGSARRRDSAVKSRRSNLHEQHLKTKILLVNYRIQWESCRRQVDMLKRELEDAKSEAESISREYVALVDERECFAREFKCRRGYLKSSKLGENGADVKKRHPVETGGCKCTKPFQSTTQSERVAVPGTGVNNHNNLWNNTKSYACCVIRRRVVENTSSRLFWRRRILKRTRIPGVFIINII